MGRKIPAKKHHGVKDPLVQQARRLQSLKTKINAPPKDPDEQPVPRSLERLFAFQNKPNLQDKQRTTKRKGTQYSKESGGRGGGGGAGAGAVAGMVRARGESGREFSQRIQCAVRALHGGLTAADYPRDDEQEDGRDARVRDFRDRRDKKRRRALARAGTARAACLAPALTRTQKLAAKRKAKKEKAEQRECERADRDGRHERVRFGDVAHAPPALTARPRPRAAAAAAPAAPAARPGRRSLLLTAMLQGAPGGPRPRRGDSEPPPAPADAMRKERARLEAIHAYRLLKANKANKPKINKIN